MQMVPMLGKLPEPWWSSWQARGQWYKDDGAPLISPRSGKPSMLMDTLEELLIGCSLPGDEPKGGKNKAGGFAVPIEESKVLGDLLRAILKYDPKERLTVEAVLEHTWFKT